jgi:DNA-binding LytR/AlgR family response regulator
MNGPLALIAEDEPILALTLHHALQRLWPELRIGAIAENGNDIVLEALAQKPDIVFLDIKMPGKTGLEAAHELAEDWPEGVRFPLVVFVTAYDDYALNAFEQAAADYVLKPVTDARLGKTVERLKARLGQMQHPGQHPGQDPNADLNRIVGQLRALVSPSPPASERLTVIRAAVGNQIRIIPVGDVMYFEATDKYVTVVTAEGESLIRTSLKELLPQLDPAVFWQIHRSTVVNVQYVKLATRDEYGKLSLKLHNHNTSLPVSRIYAHLFRQT